MSNLTLQVQSPAPRDLWQFLLEADERALVFQTPEWMDCLVDSRTYIDISRGYEFSNGIRAVLPLVKQENVLRLFPMAASMPHGWGMGGILSSTPLQAVELSLILQDLRALNYLRLSLRANPTFQNQLEPIAHEFDSAEAHTTHILDLQAGFDHYWSKVLSSKTRTKLRKAERLPLTIERGFGEQAVTEYYKLYMKWTENRARDRRIPLPLARALGRWREPQRKFSAVSRGLGESCQFWFARLDRKIVAAAVLLVYGTQAFYWRSCSDKSLAGPVRANELLQLRMIESACEAGCRTYHMGESGGVQSLVAYKEKFGAAGCQYNEYYIENLPLANMQAHAMQVMRFLEDVFLRAQKTG